MPRSNNQEKFLQFRATFPYLVYDGYKTESLENGLFVRYRFDLSGKYLFHPTLFFPFGKFFVPGACDPGILDNCLFHIGMIELISYWKTTCPPDVIVKNRSLDDAQVAWWKKLYFQGLGEFLYLNGIDSLQDKLVDFRSENGTPTVPVDIKTVDSSIIPIGGGKDSVVTLELMGGKSGNVPLIVNPREASIRTARLKGFEMDSIIRIDRTIDPLLLELNEQGFLNGHTPFSALLAFISLLAAIMSGRKYIAFSNESSANEATVGENGINHQYSKSFEFESDFRWYMNRYITSDISYFSFLRPLNELQIARLFSRFPKYFNAFRSCNAGSKTDSWCGKCPKCLFTFLILSPFLSTEQLTSIFGKNLFKDNALIPILDELTGVAETKPFDCIGTVDEVNAAVSHTIRNYQEEKLPALLEYYWNSGMMENFPESSFQHLLKTFDPDHFLSPEQLLLLKSYMHD